MLSHFTQSIGTINPPYHINCPSIGVSCGVWNLNTSREVININYH